ncbi:MAG: hypothetical protein LBT20_05440, partial [Clostridiales bacterium]|nr:hypothetical protein [Clostridiales bacterium]
MSYVEMSFLGAFVALVGVAALTGFTRGFKRSTYKLALVIVAALVTVAVLPMVLDQIMSVNIQSVSGKEIELLGVKLTSLDQWIGGVASKYADQFLGSGATESLAGSIALISGILKMLISVLIFELLFIIINLLFTLLFHITKGFVDN